MEIKRLYGLAVGALALGGCVSNAQTAPHNAQPAASAPIACENLLAGQFAHFDIVVSGAAQRSIPMTVLHPRQPGTYPVIAFSHGAFAAPDRYFKLVGPLAASGHIVIVPMHVDSEDFAAEVEASQADTWRFRNEDMRLALNVPASISNALTQRGQTADQSRTIAMGHSYGALIAQLAGGARALEESGMRADQRVMAARAVVAWSPPGVLPGRVDPQSWSTLAVPSLTITGTADILPGFIDDWQAHKASYLNAPSGSAELWVGEGIDHYFGGLFGREKAADDASDRLFQEALERTLSFSQRAVGAEQVCAAGELAQGETYETR